MYGRLILASLLIAATVCPSFAETNGEYLARQAATVWDAVHAKDSGRILNDEQRALFNRIDALTKIDSFEPGPVAKALGLKARFEKTKETEYWIFYAAKESSGSIKAVDLRERRPGTNGPPGFIVVDVAGSLDIEPQDASVFFGEEKGVSGPGVHSGPNDPFYLIYPRAKGSLKLGFRPGKRAVLVHAIWDTAIDD